MDMEKIVSLCRRRGFIFQSSEIYGGINGFWDYGPLGVELKKNIKDTWWQDMVRNPPLGPDGQEIQMVGVDCSIIMNPKVWEASGHVGGFSDPMVDCKESKSRYRADKAWQSGFYGDVKQPPAFFKDLASNTRDEFLSFDAVQQLAAKLQLSNVATFYEKHLPHVSVAVEADNAQDALTAAISRLNKKQRESLGRPIVYRIYDQMTIPEGWPRISPATQKDTLTAPRTFNLMFKTFVGALEDASSVAYLRPETAQGIFVNFKNVLDSTRLKLPFGIAQVGKAFRNEINPRNFTFRSREFEQMEIEFFCHPDESTKWYEYWRDVRKAWYTKLGIQSERLRPREQGKDELAFYSVGTTDIEYLFPFSDEPQELEGVAHRGDYDLTQHMKHSGKDLTYFEEELWAKADKSPYGGDKKKEQEAKSKMPYRYTPHVIEPSAGADRFTLAVLCEAYTEDKAPDEKGVMQERIVMKFHPRLAPIKAAVLPLVNKEGMPEIAYQLYRDLKQQWNVFYDDGGAIGRRYRRQDEAGTPYCITIDGQTLQDQTVTMRDRDTLKQERVRLKEVANVIAARLR